MYPRPLGKKHNGQELIVAIVRTPLFFICLIYKPWAYGDAWFVIEFLDNSGAYERKWHLAFWKWYTPDHDTFK